MQVTTDHSNRAPRWIEFLLALLFFLMIATPMLCQMMGYSNDRLIVLNELRRVAEMPAFPKHLYEVSGACKQFEAYLNDHFGFRSRLVKLNGYWHFALGGTGTTQVVRGKDGWLYSTSSNFVDSYRGLNAFSPEELRRCERILKQRVDWCKSKNIGMYYFLLPQSLEIYPQYGPDWMTRVAPTRMSQYIAAGKEYDVSIPDIRPYLRGLAATAPLYFKTDMHWNDVGAYWGYRFIMDRVTVDYPRTHVIATDEFNWVHVEHEGFSNAVAMNIQDYCPEPYAYKVDWPDQDKPLKAYSYESGKWKPTSLDNTRNHKMVVKVVNNDSSGPSLLIYRDSFSNGMSQYLNRSFRQVIYMPYKSLTFEEDVVEREHPDLVIYEAFERNLIMEPEYSYDRNAKKPPDKTLIVYGQKITATRVPASAAAGSIIHFPIHIENAGNWTWPANGAHCVRLFCKWRNLSVKESNNLPAGQNDLPGDIAPGLGYDAEAAIQVPKIPGSYIMRFTMVQGGIQFFDLAEAETLDLPIKIYGQPMTIDAPAHVAAAEFASIRGK